MGRLAMKQTDTELLDIFKTRFNQHPERHPEIAWDSVQKKLLQNPRKLAFLKQMESTGGEPDVVGYDSQRDEYLFYDCSSESPKGRRSLCYDRKALEGRKINPPESSACDEAEKMGIDLLSEDEYRYLQSLGKFDVKTSSWIKTPQAIRDLGGALFCDFRYNTVFVYHNGADSYYGARGFRGALRV
ncbi:MAG: DUF4256 domain-containing protein [Spirochaetales bacterium]|jgi:hypothetical protein|nr:DUF4256 domain-containing protein [Spirochaetales bacterium]